MRVKNWNEFQHYKERNPPWIKLHREIANKYQFMDLPDSPAKTLILLWIVAAEDKEKVGNLPSLKSLAFRLRISVKLLKEHLSKLEHFVKYDTLEIKDKDEKPKAKPKFDFREKDLQLIFDAWPVGFKNLNSARDEWKKLIKKDLVPTLQFIFNNIQQLKQTHNFIENNKYIPHLKNYIKFEKWNDAVVLPAIQKSKSALAFERDCAAIDEQFSAMGKEDDFIDIKGGE